MKLYKGDSITITAELQSEEFGLKSPTQGEGAKQSRILKGWSTHSPHY